MLALKKKKTRGQGKRERRVGERQTEIGKKETEADTERLSLLAGGTPHFPFTLC